MSHISKIIVSAVLFCILTCGLFAWNVSELPIFKGDIKKVEYKVVDAVTEGEVVLIEDVYYLLPYE